MELIIRNTTNQPIYDQIYSEIKAQIIAGKLSPGEALPSIRALAKDLRISVITTKRAYDELEADGFLYTVAGKGCFVAEKNLDLIREQKLKELEEKAAAGTMSAAELENQKKAMELVEKYLHGLFPQWGIRFVSIVDNADTDVKGNKKSRQINGLVNEWYLEDMSDNIRSVLRNRRENGFHIGATALYGYQKDPEQKGHLIIDEEAAQVVREVFTLFSQGYGKSAIARILNDRGVPNPTEYKRRKGIIKTLAKQKNSTLWKYYTIADMLENEMYIGNMVQGKYGSVSYKTKKNKPRPKEQWYRVEGTHEPIIEKELWEKVKEMREQKAKPFTTGAIGLFSGKARCAECGYVLRSGKRGEWRFLTCPNRSVSKDACGGAFISVSRLESKVLAELKRLAEIYLDQDALEQGIQWRSDFEKQKRNVMDRMKSYEKKIQEHTKALRELYLDKVRGILAEEDYLDMAKAFSMEKKHLEEALDTCRERIQEIEQRQKAGENRKALVEKYIHVEHLTREMVEGLIDHIDVGRRIPGSRDVPITVYWNF